MEQFAVLEFGSTRQLEAIEMRRRILRGPLGLDFSEAELAAENEHWHLGLIADGKLIACLIMQTAALGIAKIRQVAVEPNLQGAGAGRRIMRHAERYALALGFDKVELNARANVVGFYRKLGYLAVGDPFIEVGIPHQKMAMMLPGPLAPMRPYEYACSFPGDFDPATQPAIWPIGALEWHGAHLPLGTDGFLAEGFARWLAYRTKGVLLPTSYTPITTLPHTLSLDVSTETLRGLVNDQLATLYTAGFRRIAIVTGHYAQGHELELYRAARKFMDAHNGALVIAATPLELLADDAMLDHAGKWETGQMGFFGPTGSIRAGALPENLKPGRDAVLGEHPKLADAGQVGAAIEKALDRWSELLLGDRAAVDEVYKAGEESYAGYEQAYFRDSWDQAIRDWWEQVRGPLSKDQ